MAIAVAHGDLYEELRRLRAELDHRLSLRPSAAEIRAALGEMGAFRLLWDPSARPSSGGSPGAVGDRAAWAGGRPILGVDGSVQSFGGGYPYGIHLLRALARSTRPREEDGGDRVVSAELFSPLREADRREIERRAAEGGGGDPGGIDAVVERLKNERLAARELHVATEGVRRFRPALVLFDGGFLRYEGLCPDAWSAYREAAREAGARSAGWIEEVGSRHLVEALRAIGCDAGASADRDLLYGLLRPGEAFLPNPARWPKGGYATAYVRLGAPPQATACDFLPEDLEAAPVILAGLAGLTPRSGRGVPLWIDLVDAEVRLTMAEAELLLEVGLGADRVERWVRPNRARRSL